MNHNPSIVRRLITLARSHADRGNTEIARRVWRRAEWLSFRCGGISGADRCPDGSSVIVLSDGLVAWRAAA